MPSFVPLVVGTTFLIILFAVFWISLIIYALYWCFKNLKQRSQSVPERRLTLLSIGSYLDSYFGTPGKGPVQTQFLIKSFTDHFQSLNLQLYQTDRQGAQGCR